MLRTVLWIAAACAAVLLALAVSRMLKFNETPTSAPAAASVEATVAPEVVPPPPPPPVEARPAPTPDELQIQEDAAATGMTTVEPEASPPTN